MNTFDAIASRRAVKHYDPAFEITEDQCHQLVNLIKLSPTAFNQQNYRFVLVKDPAMREQIKEAAHGQQQVVDASLHLCCVLIFQPGKITQNVTG